MNNLNSLKEIAYQAYLGTSFDPEKRRDQILKELSEELKEDLKDLGDNTGNYEGKYISYAHNWLWKKSRCMSVMITGPANFPVRRNEKANNAEDKAWKDFRDWRIRYSKAVNRIHNLSPEDDIEVAIKKVDKLIINQEKMKMVNKIIRQKHKTDEAKIAELGEYGIFVPMATVVLENGFPSYALTNNNARIKAAKDKILILKRRIEVKTEFEPLSFPGGVIDIENDRVIIRHDEKPDRDVIDRIKHRGFHWSRNYGNWSRKHTVQALYDAKEIVGLL